jgi:hypothetical protein
MIKKLIAMFTAKRSPPPAAKPPPSQILNLADAGAHLAMLSGKPIREFCTRDFGREEYRDAYSIIVEQSETKELLGKIRSHLGPSLIAFIGEKTKFSASNEDGAEIVVALGSTQFDILRVAASDAVNYGMGTEELIRKLVDWDDIYGIDIFQAETDTIQLRLKSLPPDLLAFANEVYEFCPDIVNQGVGSVDELVEAIRSLHGVFLWWD